VAAVAQGLSISSFLNDLNSSMPNYRFNYLLQHTIELCSELKAASSMCLSIKEKRNSEALGLLKAKQDSAMQALIKVRGQVSVVRRCRDLHFDLLVLGIRLKQRRAAFAGQGREISVPIQRRVAVLEKCVERFVCFVELQVLSSFEKTEQDEASNAKDANDKVGPTETVADFLLSLPIVTSKVQPWGLEVGLGWGAGNFGHSHSYKSTSASRKAAIWMCDC
jgi:hypothetical protein